MPLRTCTASRVFRRRVNNPPQLAAFGRNNLFISRPLVRDTPMVAPAAEEPTESVSASVRPRPLYPLRLPGIDAPQPAGACRYPSLLGAAFRCGSGSSGRHRIGSARRRRQSTEARHLRHRLRRWLGAAACEVLPAQRWLHRGTATRCCAALSKSAAAAMAAERSSSRLDCMKQAQCAARK